MPTKQPIPPPKFNIRDQVLYNFSRWQVTEREYKSCNWWYKLEAIEENKQGVNNTKANEKFITLSSPSPPQETKPDPEQGHFDDIENKWIPEPNPFEGRNNQTVVNEQGGRQSHFDARFDCIPPVVLRLLAQCLGFGARKYGDTNWKKIPQRDNLNHAMNHINEWNRGNRDEPHLVNAMARLTFALWQAVDSKDQPDTYIHPDDHDTKTTT